MNSLFSFFLQYLAAFGLPVYDREPVQIQLVAPAPPAPQLPDVPGRENRHSFASSDISNGF